MKKTWNKQYLICSCNSFVVAASDVWVKLGHFSKIQLNVYTVALLPPLCYSSQVNMQVFVSHYVYAQFICEGDKLGQCIPCCSWTSTSWTIIITLRVQWQPDWSSSAEADARQMCKVKLTVLRAIFMRQCALTGSEQIMKKLNEAHMNSQHASHCIWTFGILTEVEVKVFRAFDSRKSSNTTLWKYFIAKKVLQSKP